MRRGNCVVVAGTAKVKVEAKHANMPALARFDFNKFSQPPKVRFPLSNYRMARLLLLRIFSDLTVYLYIYPAVEMLLVN